jgi:flagellar assembly factor FliW
MQNKNTIIDELKEITPFLIPLQGKSIPYSISTEYFSTLPENILNKLHSNSDPSCNFTTVNPYVFPADYFTTLPEIIIRKIRMEESKSRVSEETAEISPLLNTINKKPVFTVPEAYFDNIQPTLGLRSEKKIKPFTTVVRTKFFNYAVAALVTGILVLGALLLKVKNSRESNTAEAVQNLSEQEIINFLKTTSPTDNVVSSSTNSTNTPDNKIKSSVSAMSDKEIQQFLKENGEQVEM